MSGENQHTDKTILLVDDDQFLLNMYSIKFTNAGFNVETSNSASGAIEKLKSGLNPTALVFDVVMPNMDGIEMIKEIRKARLAKDSVLVALTNQGQSADVEEANRLGVDGYIVKASTVPSEVVDELQNIIKKAYKNNKD
ncbi:MAG: response regulator [bacterium]|nr:response regulator [bacterium]